VCPTRKVMNVGGTEIQVLFLGRAHNGRRSIRLSAPAKNILFMSEGVLQHRLFPSLYGGYPNRVDRKPSRKAEAMNAGHLRAPDMDSSTALALLREELTNFPPVARESPYRKAIG